MSNNRLADLKLEISNITSGGDIIEIDTEDYDTTVTNNVIGICNKNGWEINQEVVFEDTISLSYYFNIAKTGEINNVRSIKPIQSGFIVNHINENGEEVTTHIVGHKLLGLSIQNFQEES